MGIIIKQSFKGTIWSYLGLLVGYINLGIIMPRFFMTEQVGLVQLIAAITTIFTNFSTLGFSSVINRLFPEFRDPRKNHHGFFPLMLFTGLLGFVLSMAAFFVFKPHIVESNIERSPLLVEYIMLLVPLFLFRIFFQLLDTYNRVLHDAITGTFWNDFIHKVINLALIILFALDVINFRQFMYGYVVSICLPTIPIVIVLLKRGEITLKPDFSFLKRPLAKEIILVSAFGLINGLSGALTTNIDKLFINQYLSLEEVGIFSVCTLFASVIMIPSRSIVKISTGIIAKAWKNNDKTQIQEIYSKASLNQTIIGAFIFAGILVNIDNIFSVLPDEYQQGAWVLIIYSFGTLVRVSATTGGTIIVTSKYYKVLTYIIGAQIFLTAGLHMLLIPVWGINGAATAVMLTYIFAIAAIVGYLKLKAGFFCYSLKHVWIILISALAISISFIIPESGSIIVNILIKSATVSLIFGALIFGFKISDEMSELVTKLVNDIIKRR